MDPRLEVIQVIRTRLLRRGRGVEGDPVRIITQYWGMDGALLFEEPDPFAAPDGAPMTPAD